MQTTQTPSKNITQPKAGICLVFQSAKGLQCLLVLHCRSQFYGFPKGSFDCRQDQNLHDTAFRELYEETKINLYDLYMRGWISNTNLNSVDKKYIESGRISEREIASEILKNSICVEESRMKIYIICIKYQVDGTPDRREVSNCAWVPLSQMVTKNNNIPQSSAQIRILQKMITKLAAFQV
jgi:8-oxo-dGTP pyrophosphatase MutT (NUDIX family)